MPAKLPYPKEVVRAFQVHRSNSKRRGIAFNFTLDEWWTWWAQDGRWAKRGRRKGCVMMCRIGDKGPYDILNVYAGTHRENQQDIPEEDRSLRTLHGVYTAPRAHLKRGGSHPRAKGVITPAGRFFTATAAAEHYGITKQYAARKAREGIDGWCYT